MEIVNREASGPIVTKDGSVIRSILDRTTSTAAHQSLAEATVAPGQETAEHYHGQSEEIYYVLRGQGIISLDGEARAVGAGDGILIPPGTRHRIRNVGTDDLVFLCCCAPPYSHEDTVLVEEESVPLAIFHDPRRAERLQAALGAAGIPCRVAADDPGHLISCSPTALTQTVVWVLATDLDRARRAGMVAAD